MDTFTSDSLTQQQSVTTWREQQQHVTGAAATSCTKGTGSKAQQQGAPVAATARHTCGERRLRKAHQPEFTALPGMRGKQTLSDAEAGASSRHQRQMRVAQYSISEFPAIGRPLFCTQAPT
jgi:hypothetical protein